MLDTSPLPRLTVFFLLSHAVSFFSLYVLVCLEKPWFSVSDSLGLLWAKYVTGNVADVNGSVYLYPLSESVSFQLHHFGRRRGETFQPITFSPLGSSCYQVLLSLQ